VVPSIEHRGGAKGLASKPLSEEEAYHPTREEYEVWIKDEGSQRRHTERLYAGGLLSGLAAKDDMKRVLDVLYGTVRSNSLGAPLGTPWPLFTENPRRCILGNLKDKSVRKGPVLLGTGPFLF
jgi:hypothetical protein